MRITASTVGYFGVRIFRAPCLHSEQLGDSFHRSRLTLVFGLTRGVYTPHVAPPTWC